MRYIVYLGSYSPRTSPGLLGYLFDEESEELTLVESVSGLKDPSFVTIRQDYDTLYTMNQAEESEEAGMAAAYRIDPSTGKLRFLNSQTVTSKSSTHINTDLAGKFLYLVSYGYGTVSLLPLESDGTIGALAQSIQHSGSSVIPKVQEKAHPHSIYPDPSDQFVLVPDLGIDKIVTYRLDRERGRLEPHDETVIAPGSGPRHFAFHHSLPYGYLISEHSSTVSVFTYDEKTGSLHETQTISTLPEGFSGPNKTAEIQVSPCGKYIYGSNRGHDSIVVYEVNQQDGKLTYVEHAATLGNHPRNFSLSPSGRHLFAANMDSDSVQLFRVDRESGKLTPMHKSISMPKPCCVRFYPL